MSVYPKPKQTGGVIMRKVVSLFKKHDFKIPSDTSVLIAVSGGADSMVLAHLLATYGRRVVAKGQITLLHLDHGWRSASAREERDGVRALAEHLGVSFLHEKLKSPLEERTHANLEADARTKRKQVFDGLVGKSKPFTYLFTAHHEDDVVETLLFRFFRGEFRTDEKGILFQDSKKIRPLLKVTKEEIYAYAKEERLQFFEDPSNRDKKHFRALCRTELLPLLESHFPAVKKTIARYAERATDRES